MDEKSIIANFLDWSWAIVAAAIAALWRHLNSRIDSKANTLQLDAAIKSIDSHLVDDKEIHERIINKLDRTNEQLGETNIKLATLIGKFNGGDHR